MKQAAEKEVASSQEPVAGQSAIRNPQSAIPYERRMADELVALRPMVVTLLAVEVAAGAIDTAQLADFLGDQQLARHIAFQAQEIRIEAAQRRGRMEILDQASKLRQQAAGSRQQEIRNPQSAIRNDAGPAFRTGPGGDFVQDYSDQDLDQAFSL